VHNEGLLAQKTREGVSDSSKDDLMSRQVLLIGKNGQLGYELNHTLLPLASVTSLDTPEFDLSNPALVRSTVRRLRPNLIINAAAYTDVEKAEEEPELANAINGIGPGILAEEVMSRVMCKSTRVIFPVVV
jgi:dTDP-4-dehydrorhamnose reductase